VRSLAIFVLVGMLPLVGSVGYAVHRNPALPSFDTYVGESQAVRHVAALDTDEWSAVAISGPNKGGQMDLQLALVQFPTHKDLERSAKGTVVYVERRCVFYSTTGKKQADPGDKTLVQRCTQQRKTRKQAENWVRLQLRSEPTS
jgi:hypothetical protein